MALKSGFVVKPMGTMTHCFSSLAVLGNIEAVVRKQLEEFKVDVS